MQTLIHNVIPILYVALVLMLFVVYLMRTGTVVEIYQEKATDIEAKAIIKNNLGMQQIVWLFKGSWVNTNYRPLSPHFEEALEQAYAEFQSYNAHNKSGV